MKYALVMVEGAADVNLEQLENRSPLQVARCANASRLAEEGQGGVLAPVQDGLDGRSEVMLAVACGLDPDSALSLQRAPLEALTTAVDPAAYGRVYRGNFVTLDDGLLSDSLVAGLTMEETRTLVSVLQEGFDPAQVRVEAIDRGRSLIWTRETQDRAPVGYPPSLMEGEAASSFLPAGKEAEWMCTFMARAAEILKAHAINEVRLDLGENPANGIWLWGGGSPMPPASLASSWGTGAVMLSSSRLALGLGKACGFRTLAMEGPADEGRKEACFRVAGLVEALQDADALIVYSPSLIELGLYGSGVDKVRALERIDQHLLSPLLTVLDAYRPYRILLTADGVVSSRDQHPTSGNAPLVLAGHGVSPDQVHRWDEQACTLGDLGTVRPGRLLDLLRKG